MDEDTEPDRGLETDDRDSGTRRSGRASRSFGNCVYEKVHGRLGCQRGFLEKRGGDEGEGAQPVSWTGHGVHAERPHRGVVSCEVGYCRAQTATTLSENSPWALSGLFPRRAFHLIY